MMLNLGVGFMKANISNGVGNFCNGGIDVSLDRQLSIDSISSMKKPNRVKTASENKRSLSPIIK